MTTQTSKTPLQTLEAIYQQNLAKFTQQLASARFWHVIPKPAPKKEDDATSTEPPKPIALFDREAQLYYPLQPLQAEPTEFLKKHPFLYLRKNGDNKNLATLHTETRLLWNNETSNTEYNLTNGQKIVAEGQWAGLKGWQLPTTNELRSFATASNNPQRRGGNYRLAMISSPDHDTCYWLTTSGRYDIDEGYWKTESSSNGCIFSLNPLWQSRSEPEILLDLLTRGWCLVAPSDSDVFPKPDTRWQGFSAEKLLATWQAEGLTFEAEGSEARLDPNFALENLLSSLDFTPCRLPKLDKGQIRDPNKGLWELSNERPEFLAQWGLVARDPMQDVRRQAVAIDFGTSSTVVAMDTRSGQRELLRIGVQDFYQAVQAKDFENPTVLECVDFDAFWAAWTDSAYRPRLNWDWMRAAHEAQTNFRDNQGDTEILASILPRLKQWALRSEQRRVRITDRKGREIELPAHSERNPVRGQPLKINQNDPFDPIELYAWYLGMAINHRERGLFLKYYLSFPVKYPRDVKERILASFRRGLQRSLPQSLIESHPQVLNEFEVNDLASEPAAYAAAALAHFDVKPTDEGVPYAVFDFGGGTTDFDFGFLRWATDDEYVQEYEQVFEHLASGGDNFLGGENLLEHLVYKTFCQNLEELRKHKIQFTQPLDAQPFSGSEAFLAKTQAAQTNTVMLAAKLRPFLEDNSNQFQTPLKMSFIDVNGQKVANCNIAVQTEALEALLKQRVFRGGEAFLAELATVNAEFPQGAPIHVLLAGNGSRSRYVTAFFEESHLNEALTKAFGEGKPVPEIVVHPPLPMDEKNPHAPTAKTGVALGLLRVSPGKNILLKNHIHAQYEGQGPFAWFVGRMRRGQLELKLLPRSSYDSWHEIGRLQEGVFYLSATNSPRAQTGMTEGDPELKVQRLDFPAAPAGARLFAKATAPSVINLAAVSEESDLKQDYLMGVQKLDLNAL